MAQAEVFTAAGFGPPLDGVEYAVVDVETTGFYAGGTDRIVEVALVRCDSTGRPTDRFVTLVNPGRDLGPVHIHGITGDAVRDAPTFRDVVGDVAERLAGAIVVGHNARFDHRFLEAEFTRAGFTLPAVPLLCTMGLPGRVGIRTTGRSLRCCCSELGVRYEPERGHSALHDAEAAAGVLVRCLEHARRRGLATLADLGCEQAPAPVGLWPRLPRCERIRTRADASAATRAEFGYLAHLARRVADSPGRGLGLDEALAPYLALLDRVLEDLVVTEQEAQQLALVAHEWGLTPAQVEAAHQLYLDALVQTAWDDGVVTAAERRELEGVAFWLGIEGDELEARIAAAQVTGPLPRAAPGPSELQGLSVCFTGQLTCLRGGRPITRDAAHEMVAAAGLEVHKSVTKRLDILVCADPNSLSGKARKARQYGARILAEHVFWRKLGVEVDSS